MTLFFLSISFFFNDTATTEIYTLSLHDALPICGAGTIDEPADDCLGCWFDRHRAISPHEGSPRSDERVDRKSTRLNSSHANISYAVFCLKKKKKIGVLH